MKNPLIATARKGDPPSQLRVSGARRNARVQAERTEWLVLEAVEFRNVDLSKQRCESLHVTGPSSFLECDFSGSRFRHSVSLGGREQAVYERCSFDRAILHGCGSNVRLVSCSFRGAQLIEWFGTALQVEDCTFEGCTIQRSKFWGRPHGIPPNVPTRARNAFRGNDFSTADLRDVSFAGGIDLDLQILPRDPRFRIVRNLAVAAETAYVEVMSWSELGARREALKIIKRLRRIASEGQSQALLDLSEWDAVPPGALDSVLQLLGAQPRS